MIKFKISLIVLLLLLSSLFAVENEIPTKYLDKIDKVPDMMQTDPAGNLPGGGRIYCAAVAAANYLTYFQEQNFIDLKIERGCRKANLFKIAKYLGSPTYMNVTPRGVGPKLFADAVERYLVDNDNPPKKISTWGWSDYNKKQVPAIDFYKNGIWGEKLAVWLLVGIYKEENNFLICKKLHWVSLVGYQETENGNEEFVVHCSSPRSGIKEIHEFVKIKKMDAGNLKIPFINLESSAKGFLQIAGGLKWKRENDIAIINGAVIIAL